MLVLTRRTDNEAYALATRLLLVLMLFLGCQLCNDLMEPLRTHLELPLKFEFILTSCSLSLSTSSFFLGGARTPQNIVSIDSLNPTELARLTHTFFFIQLTTCNRDAYSALIVGAPLSKLTNACEHLRLLAAYRAQMSWAAPVFARTRVQRPHQSGF